MSVENEPELEEIFAKLKQEHQDVRFLTKVIFSLEAWC